MARKLKIYCPDGSYAGAYSCKPFFRNFIYTEQLDDADCVLFSGGSDISPELYGEAQGRNTYPSAKPRDILEKAVFLEAKRKGKRFIGICRGAQLLCALGGGKLVQHIDGHAKGYSSYHRIMTYLGEELMVNTLHHQMMYPKDIPHKILAWTEKLSSQYLDGNNLSIPGIDVEPEVVYFPEIKGFAIQGHPESGMVGKHNDTIDFLNEEALKHLFLA